MFLPVNHLPLPTSGGKTVTKRAMLGRPWKKSSMDEAKKRQNHKCRMVAVNSMGMACEVLFFFPSLIEVLICGDMVFKTLTLSRIDTTSQSDASCGLESVKQSRQQLYYYYCF